MKERIQYLRTVPRVEQSGARGTVRKNPIPQVYKKAV